MLFAQAAAAAGTGPLPDDFFKVESMVNFGVVVLMTTVICNALQRALNFNPRWLALLVAEIICLANFAMTGGKPLIGWLVAFANGCLVYLTAVGANSVGNQAVNTLAPRSAPAQPQSAEGTGPVARGAGKRSFWSPWF
jgi:hypothetical protein